MHSAAAVSGILQCAIKPAAVCGPRRSRLRKRNASSCSLPCRHNGIVDNDSAALHARCKAPYSACRSTMKPWRQTLRGRSPRPVTTNGGQSFTANEPITGQLWRDSNPLLQDPVSCALPSELHKGAIAPSLLKPYTERVMLILPRETLRAAGSTMYRRNQKSAINKKPLQPNRRRGS